ncbi:hypothetical protein GALMADRAFT_136174 [Galerina marginata CBS 339.88]|uniref:TEA domain-containing protein n=1 Tax=Galerina marginata (strain CBS 339.88) TaxID=685588 RepID=A0A067TD39_GALM3|nr:hypothetical protein GALMADRAFT_136174 [Galerina marginata CBS 339.88]
MNNLSDMKVTHKLAKDVKQDPSGRRGRGLQNGESIWPEDVELALLDGFHIFGNSDTVTDGKKRNTFLTRRNILIIDYIHEKTGKKRSVTQVSRRIQEMKRSGQIGKVQRRPAGKDDDCIAGQSGSSRLQASDGVIEWECDPVSVHASVSPSEENLIHGLLDDISSEASLQPNAGPSTTLLDQTMEPPPKENSVHAIPEDNFSSLLLVLPPGPALYNAMLTQPRPPIFAVFRFLFDGQSAVYKLPFPCEITEFTSPFSHGS